jgi:hypothetical protein
MLHLADVCVALAAAAAVAVAAVAILLRAARRGGLQLPVDESKLAIDFFGGRNNFLTATREWKSMTARRYAVPHVGFTPSAAPPRESFDCSFAVRCVIGTTALRAYAMLPEGADSSSSSSSSSRAAAAAVEAIQIVEEAERVRGERSRTNPAASQAHWRAVVAGSDTTRASLELPTATSAGLSQLRAVAFLFPGLNECVDRNAHLARALARRGVLVLAIDYPVRLPLLTTRLDSPCAGIRPQQRAARLHPQRAVPRCHCRALCGRDERAGACRESHPFRGRGFADETGSQSVPRFAVGQSLGGAMSIRMCLARPAIFSGAVLFAPAVRTELKPALQCVSALVAALSPKLRMPRLGDFDLGCSNLAIAEELENDPLLYTGLMYAATGDSLLRLLKHVVSVSPPSSLASLTDPRSARMQAGSERRLSCCRASTT